MGVFLSYVFVCKGGTRTANLECYVVFVDVVPLLETDFFSTGTSLRRNELLEVANRVVCVALDAHLQTSCVRSSDSMHALELCRPY
jgi:hypothetical protein